MIEFAKEDIAAILNLALSGGGDFADLYISECDNSVVSVAEGRIQSFYGGSTAGAGLRLLKGDLSLYFHTNEVTEASLKKLAIQARDSLNSGSYGFISPLCGRNSAVKTEMTDIRLIGDLMGQVNEYSHSLDPAIKQIALSCALGHKTTLIGNSRGRFVMDCRNRQRFVVRAVGEKDGELQTAVVTLGDTNPNFVWNRELLCAKVDEAADRVCLLLKAKPAPSGDMTVILSSSAGGTMVHEACGHGLEGDHIVKNLSVYSGKLGQEVASPKITVIDDATLRGHYGSYNIDDEGETAQKKVLIENGVLRQYMYDIRTAKKEGTASTGNGRRESYRCIPQVRMSNTYIAPGDDEPEAILADTPKGIFVKKIGGGQVNTANGDFVFEVSEGYIIEKGRLTYPIKNATLIGNGPKTLSSVFAVGSDLGFAIGTCGKGGQSVPVGDAQPTLGLTDVIVGGTAR